MTGLEASSETMAAVAVVLLKNALRQTDRGGRAVLP